MHLPSLAAQQMFVLYVVLSVASRMHQDLLDHPQQQLAGTTTNTAMQVALSRCQLHAAHLATLMTAESSRCTSI
jgi:hypothetical protein